MPDGALTVLLCTEGTYPFVHGGVSTWCDILCRQLSEVDYTLYAITGQPEAGYVHEPPPNARRVVHIPLWGTEEPAAYMRAGDSFAELRRRKRATGEAAIEAEFVPLLRSFLEGMRGEAAGAGEHGPVVHRMWRYFQAHDWKASWRSEAAWRIFCEETLRPYRESPESFLPGEVPTVGDLTTAMRWMYHFLAPLGAPIPAADIVHTTIAAYAGLPGIVAKQERGTPFLITEHGVWVRERHIGVATGPFSAFGKLFLMSLGGFVARLNYRYADVVAPVTSFNRRWEVPFGTDPRKIETIFNGIDPAVFVPRPRPERAGGRPTVVAAARLFPLKDIETMIRSAAVVRREIPEVRYVLYGDLDADPAYTERCRGLIAELGLERTFELAGHHENPAEVYAEGDLTALSSISEAFPYTVLESLACGRPVVGTDVGGVRECLEGFGLVVPPRDPEAFGRAVIRLLGDEELRVELGRRGREHVLARYRISGVADAYRGLYGRLAGAAA